MKRQLQIAIGVVLLGLFVWSYTATVKTDDAATFRETLGMVVAAWLTLIILSFLYRDNPVYKAAEHMMVGLAMGYFAVYYAFQVLKPRFWDKLVYGQLGEDDVLFGSAVVFRWALLVPAILGVLMLTRIFPKVAWLSRWSIAATIGISSGLAIPVTIQANITTQLEIATMLPIQYASALYGTGVPAGFTLVPLWQIGVPLLIIGTICGLMYFFFSVPHRGAFGFAASLGVWFLMVGFGASFGFTVMARLSLFIGRAQFLLRDWLHFLPK